MQIRCTLANASTLISGVAFAKTESGMVSEDIDEVLAKRFLTIPGYVIHTAAPPAAVAPAPAPAPTAAAPAKRGRSHKAVTEDHPS